MDDTEKTERERAFDEAGGAPVPSVTFDLHHRDELWKAYLSARHAAELARRNLVERLAEGVPKAEMLPNGGFDGMAGIKRLEVKELIDRFVVANRGLWDMAQTVCDVLQLADDGAEECVEWEVKLVPTGRYDR